MKTKEHFHGHRKRLKEKFQNSPNTLLDYEILELLLGYIKRGSDVKPQAKGIISKFGYIGNVFRNRLQDISGIGGETQLFFDIIKELIYRCEKSKGSKEKNLTNPRSVYEILKYKIGMAGKECFCIVYLNSNHKLIDIDVLPEGTINSVHVFPREVVELVVKRKATKVIIAHNHPSGVLKPSESDLALTIRIKHALSTIDAILADHIIVTNEDYFSFKNNHLLD